MIRAALYAGSFDPVTNGHLDVIRAVCGMFDRLILAIGTHHSKTPLFSAKDRVALLEEVCTPVARENGCALEIITFDDLVTSAAMRANASVLVRGLRDGTDFDYEMQMAGMNGALAPHIRTVFLPASTEYRPVGATFVRQIAAMGGDVSHFVPEAVAVKLAARFGNAIKE